MGWIKNRIDKEKKKHEEFLDWSLIAEKKLISTIMDWCYKNNTIKVGKLNLATTDGGYVNVIKLKKFLENENNENK